MEYATISKMKVADLKKELKTRNLSIGGNKNELVDRLHEALNEDMDEDEILGTSVDDGSKMSAQEEAAVLAGKVKPVTAKRSVSATNGDAGKPTQNGESAAKVAKVEDDPLAARSKRFGVVSSEQSKKAVRAERFGVTDPKTGETVDMDKLKSRAERFGEVTAKNLTKIETDEKKKARMERFGLTTEQQKKVDTDAAKEARSARFGTSEVDVVIKEKVPEVKKPVASPVKAVASPVKKAVSSPVRAKVASPAAKIGTPAAKIGTPAAKVATPAAKLAVSTPRSNRKPIAF